MGIEAGRFFVNLGLTGAEKTVSGLAQVNDHFSGLKGISTEAKLAILAALAGLEQMVSYSGKFGNELTKSTAYLNMNTQAIQMWDNAAQRAGATAGQTTKQFESIRNHMLDIVTGNGPQNFLPTLMSEMGAQGQKFTPEEEKGQAGYWAEHPDLLFKHFLQLHKRKGLSDSMLGYMFEGAGIDTDLTARNKKFGAFSDKNMAIARSESISANDVANLAKMNMQWKDFELTTQKILLLLSEKLGPVVSGMAEDAHALVKFMEGANRLSDVIEKRSHEKHPTKGLEGLYYDLHPELKNHIPQPTSKQTVVNLNATTNVNVNNPGDKFLKTIDTAIDDGLKKIYTKTISKMFAVNAGP